MSSAPSDDHCAIIVWRIDLRVGDPPDFTLLDARERAAADAFVHADDRDRYARTHCALRRLLSDALDVPPDKVPVAVGPNRKPFLAGTGQTVTFNISHSRNTALIAIGRSTEIGVDVEDDDKSTGYSELIDTVFDEETAKRLHCEDPSRRRQLFLRGWTRKEAVAKAFGSGFLIDPKEFKVPLDNGSPWTVCLDNGAKFALADLSDATMIAALAVEDRMPRLLLRNYHLEREQRRRGKFENAQKSDQRGT